MREILARMIDWFNRDKLDRELTEELAFHRQQLERDAQSRGADDEHARREASRRLGNATAVHERSRDRWSLPRLDRLQQDVRYAFRTLGRSPAYAATVIVTLALGIGANVTMVSVVDRLMFRPLPMLRDPSTVHRIYQQSINRGEWRTRPSMEYLRYLDFQNWTSSFSQFAAFSERPLAVGVGDASRERMVGAVSASFFEFFDARPALGRFFVREEDRTPRGSDVAVLSWPFWQSEFGGRDVRGTILQVGNVSAEIIGVTPKGFTGVNQNAPPEVFIPITTYAGSTGSDDSKTYFNQYFWNWMSVIARRKPGMTLDAANADLTRAYQRSWNAQRDREPRMRPLEEAKPRAVASGIKPWAGPDPALEARTALWLTGLAGIVLIIAAANTANLALARALRRHREDAVRLALGAGRGRLVAQAVIENLLLTLAAAVLGLLFAQWGGAAVRGLLAADGSGVTATALNEPMDWRMMLVAFALAGGVAVVMGVVAAFASARGDLAPVLRGGARGGVAHRAGLRGALLVVQGALTVVLLIGAALFSRSLAQVRAMPMGYDAERVLRVNRIERGASPTFAERVALRKALLAAARSIPEVKAAAWVSSTPFISTSSTGLYIQGIDSVAALGEFSYQATTADYFTVMGTRILRGRGLEERDRGDAQHVVVISEGMASVLWPGQDALGKCMRVFTDTMPCAEVVGIAEDIVQRDLMTAKRLHYYLPIEQFTRTNGNGMLLLMRGDPAVQGEIVRKALQRVMPGASYVTVQPLADIVAGVQRSWRLGATLLLAFGALALIVAAVGLYGVISYNVAQRMHELGVRIALGATPARILKLVVVQSVRLVALGVAIGTLLALAASRWVEPLLFKQSATDPLSYSAVAALMLTVALLASASPAITAANADPNAALRAE